VPPRADVCLVVMRRCGIGQGRAARSASGGAGRAESAVAGSGVAAPTYASGLARRPWKRVATCCEQHG
jgi:hypothetical protein